jgi:hypothetical protein
MGKRCVSCPTECIACDAFYGITLSVVAGAFTLALVLAVKAATK